PGFLLTIEVEGLVDIEIRLLLEQFHGVGHTLAAALLVPAEDDESRFDVAGLDGVIEFVAILFEFRDVAGVEVATAAIDGVQIAIQDETGKPVIEGGAAI